MLKQRSVMLAPNQAVPWDSRFIAYPMYASCKYDGNRLLIKNGEILSRTLKPWANKFLPNHLKDLVNLSQEHKLVFDAEFYSHKITFQEIQSVVRSFHSPIPIHMNAYVFDMLTLDEWETGTEPIFSKRIDRLNEFLKTFSPDQTIRVEQILVNSPQEAKEIYGEMLAEGYEGVMLRHPKSKYRHGRATLNQGDIFKFKEFVTVDAKIIGYEQKRRMKPEFQTGDRTRDVMGYLERSHKQEHYEYVEEIGSVRLSTIEGKEFGAGFSKGFDPKQYNWNWNTRHSFIGKMVEVRYMSIGMKDLPRMGGILRFRPDLDGVF